MTNTALRVYTTVIALICGGAVAWSIHQSSITTAWQADARSWHSLAAQAVAHDRLTTRSMHQMVVRYDQLVVRTRRSQHKLLVSIRKAQRDDKRGLGMEGDRHHLADPSHRRRLGRPGGGRRCGRRARRGPLVAVSP